MAAARWLSRSPWWSGNVRFPEPSSHPADALPVAPEQKGQCAPASCSCTQRPRSSRRGHVDSPRVRWGRTAVARACARGRFRRGFALPGHLDGQAEEGTKSNAMMETSTGVGFSLFRKLREISLIPFRAGVAGRTISISSSCVFLNRVNSSVGIAGGGRGSSLALLKEMLASFISVADWNRMTILPFDRLTVPSPKQRTPSLLFRRVRCDEKRQTFLVPVEKSVTDPRSRGTI